MTWLFTRSFVLQLVTLCTAFGVLWAPVAEAAECAGEPAVASQLEQHDEPGDDDRAWRSTAPALMAIAIMLRRPSGGRLTPLPWARS